MLWFLETRGVVTIALKRTIVSMEQTDRGTDSSIA